MSDETQAVIDRVRRIVAREESNGGGNSSLFDRYGCLLYDPSDSADVHRGTLTVTDLRTLCATVDALREDARRMDWLEAFAVRYPWVRVSMDSPGAWCLDNGHNTVAFDAPHVRAAIDAARVGGQP